MLEIAFKKPKSALNTSDLYTLQIPPDFTDTYRAFVNWHCGIITKSRHALGRLNKMSLPEISAKSIKLLYVGLTCLGLRNNITWHPMARHTYRRQCMSVCRALSMFNETPVSRNVVCIYLYIYI